MFELQDIFYEHGEEYRKTHRLPLNVLKAMTAVEACRTAELGGHVDECDECGHVRISYNSCRNRHCPKCQTLAKERWLEDRKHLGAQIGFTSILHTWGQNLMHHPHIHCVIPGGGLSLDGTRWINSKEDFFIPVKVLSRKFRGKFLYYIKKAYYNNKLKLIGNNRELIEKYVFQCFIDKLYKKEWVVYCKPPFSSAEHVLKYLGRYTHRVAISNNRLVFFDNGYVTFKWRDYRDNNKQKFMTVTAEEFIRRFLMHILPDKFVKIRHYGILSNRNRVTKLKKCKELTGSVFKVTSISKLSSTELLFKLAGIDLNVCPCCTKGKMVRQGKLQPRNFSPPNALVKIL